MTDVRTEDSVCDHCGKAERFNVLCPDCEELACNECGRVECVCAREAARALNAFTSDLESFG
jgi:hypothetical protein